MPGGECITFSAATVISALLTLLVASFGLYQPRHTSLGAPLAIAIALMLLADLTLVLRRDMSRSVLR